MYSRYMYAEFQTQSLSVRPCLILGMPLIVVEKKNEIWWKDIKKNVIRKFCSIFLMDKRNATNSDESKHNCKESFFLVDFAHLIIFSVKRLWKQKNTHTQNITWTTRKQFLNCNLLCHYSLFRVHSSQKTSCSLCRFYVVFILKPKRKVIQSKVQ